MDKLEILEKELEGKDNFLLAFSGGLDSAFLAFFLKKKGKNFIAATVDNGMIPDLEAIKKEAKCLDIPHTILEADLFSERSFVENDPERCYFCKKQIISVLEKFKDEKGLEYIVDGTNKSDLSDYRAGIIALHEAGVFSPLLDAEFSKEDIIRYSREFSLNLKPPESCLATRIQPYTWIRTETIESLRKIESRIRALGISLVRARVHEKTIRLQVLESEMVKVIEKKEEIRKIIEGEDYLFASLDLNHYPFEYELE